LEVRGLNKSYPAFSLKDLSFEVPAGYICGFIGPNGSGKTTTIKSILGITRPDSGEIRLFGGAEHSNVEIGVVMDAPYYVADWTVDEVERNLSRFYETWDAGAFAGYLKRFELDRDKKVKDLSRGMKVKIQLAVALSHKARLLILDEPTSGLDPVARDEVCDILREFVLDEAHSVLFSTHITSDLEKTADFITFIMDGRLVFTGAKDALIEKYARVTGGLGELSTEEGRLLIGRREHGSGFEGLVETKNLRKLPRGVLTEQTSLDEIVIFMNREAKSHE
jgi:ABC-2 type transport system ATP-binding protein